MTLEEAMAALEKAGTAQTKKTWLRHGLREPIFGVKFGDLGVLVKTIKVDHALAKALWDTGNGDARNLAMLVADPSRTTRAELDQWARELDWYGGSGALANLAARTPFARDLADEWTTADAEWIERAGWGVVLRLVEDASLPDEFFAPWLERIERDLHRSKNFVRDAMNTALITIGGRSPVLRERAEAAARRIGNVEVDWGETSCETKDAVAYIARIWEHREKKAAKKPAAKKPAAKKPKR